MVTATLSSDEARRLRREFEGNISRPRQKLPEIMALDRPLVSVEARPSVHGVPVESVESTLNRVWGGDSKLKVMELDERWKPDKPEVALIKTDIGDRVLKAEKQETGQHGIVNEGIAQLFSAELSLRSIRMGVGGLKRRV